MSRSANFSVLGDKGTETSEAPESVSADNTDAFRWNVRPSDKEPRKRWGVLIAAVIAFFAGLLLVNALVGLIGFAIILGTTAEFWLGTSYKLDAGGASVRCALSYSSMTWDEVERAMVEAEGVKLSPLQTESRLDTFRGLFLKFGNEDRNRVLGAIRRYLPENVRLLEG